MPQRAKMKATSLVLMPLHQGKIVMMKLRVVEMMEIVLFAKGRQDDKKLLLFGEWHMEQHHVTFRLQETLECRYRLKGFQPYDLFALFINNDLLNCFAN